MANVHIDGYMGTPTKGIETPTRGEMIGLSEKSTAPSAQRILAHSRRGTMVFWDGQLRPYWVIEWQPDNGDGCYWIVDGEGNHATASEDELSLTPNN